MSCFAINPINLVRTLSLSLDMIVGGTNMHQLRTAVICKHIAEELHLDSSAMQPLLNAALLHDIGAAPDHNELYRLTCPKEEILLGSGVFAHAEAGWKLLDKASCFQDSSLMVRHHHDRWDGGNPIGASKDSIPLGSRIIHLADRVEIHVKKALPILAQRDSIRESIVAGQGSQFDPDIVEAFFRCSVQESFWLDIMHPDFFVGSFDPIYNGVTVFTAPQLLCVAGMFATLIDRKSIFTATHSRSVAEVAVLLARHHGFNESERYMMRIAGYLHDLGKLSIHNDILEKPGPLTPDEMSLMRQHPYYTHRILSQIDDMRQIAEWAAFHHETLDGKGYPFRKSGEELPLGARIMAVADIFVALAENRPYRNRLAAPAVRGLMSAMVESNKIDSRIVDSLYDLYDQADAVVLMAGDAAAMDMAFSTCTEA